MLAAQQNAHLKKRAPAGSHAACTVTPSCAAGWECAWEGLRSGRRAHICTVNRELCVQLPWRSHFRLQAWQFFLSREDVQSAVCQTAAYPRAPTA
ncbi:hypothetical protein P154DRAFT_521558 [Amniculicola lignicola CBS 123094]|uniref:Uncharacterized protein n=1 Tax=Amniculicola lignicola CBS 123094 TaxID=1392246 RepID=A0A6A5WNQ1_9PLEO|nr:hypothetical protein P154DRAFT_521558 [Amniculicola lignicola CBS 123094]